MREYETVIGLEVHCELATKTKIFCSCKTDFGAPPNTQCCPVCMGFPGTLPVLHKQVVHYAVLAGLAAGVWSGLEDQERLRRSQHVFLPRRDAGSCAADYRRWRRAVERSRRWEENEL